MSLAFHSLGCGIGYGYLHRIPTQPSGHYKKPGGTSPSGTPAANTPQPSDVPLGAPPPWPILQDSSSPELGSRHSDYTEVCGETCHGRDGRNFWGSLPMGLLCLEEAHLPQYAVEAERLCLGSGKQASDSVALGVETRHWWSFCEWEIETLKWTEPCAAVREGRPGQWRTR